MFHRTTTGNSFRLEPLARGGATSFKSVVGGITDQMANDAMSESDSENGSDLGRLVPSHFQPTPEEALTSPPHSHSQSSFSARSNSPRAISKALLVENQDKDSQQDFLLFDGLNNVESTEEVTDNGGALDLGAHTTKRSIFSESNRGTLREECDMFMYLLRQEWHSENVNLNAVTAQGFVDWPSAFGDRSTLFFRGKWVPFMAFRLTMALVWLAVTIHSLQYYYLNDDLQYWLIYLTNWTLLLQLVYFLSALYTAYLSRNVPLAETQQLPWFVRLMWVSKSITLPGALLVSLLYWGVLWDGNLMVSSTSVSSHLINSVMMLIDTVLTPHPFLLLHGFYVCFYGLCFFVWTFIHYLLGLSNDNGDPFIYGIVDWHISEIAGKVGFALIVIVLPLFQLVVWWVFHLRGRVRTQLLLQDAMGSEEYAFIYAANLADHATATGMLPPTVFENLANTDPTPDFPRRSGDLASTRASARSNGKVGIVLLADINNLLSGLTGASAEEEIVRLLATAEPDALSFVLDSVDIDHLLSDVDNHTYGSERNYRDEMYGLLSARASEVSVHGRWRLARGLMRRGGAKERELLGHLLFGLTRGDLLEELERESGDGELIARYREEMAREARLRLEGRKGDEGQLDIVSSVLAMPELTRLQGETAVDTLISFLLTLLPNNGNDELNRITLLEQASNLGVEILLPPANITSLFPTTAAVLQEMGYAIKSNPVLLSLAAELAALSPESLNLLKEDSIWNQSFADVLVDALHYAALVHGIVTVVLAEEKGTEGSLFEMLIDSVMDQRGEVHWHQYVNPFTRLRFANRARVAKKAMGHKSGRVVIEEGDKTEPVVASLSILQTIFEDSKNGFSANAEAGFHLMTHPYGSAPIDGLSNQRTSEFQDSGLVSRVAPLHRLWVHLHQSWSLCHAAHLRDEIYGVFALLAPEMSAEAREHNCLYIARYDLAQFLHDQWVLTTRASRASAVPHHDFTHDSLSILWGKVNQVAAEQYVTQVERVISSQPDAGTEIAYHIQKGVVSAGFQAFHASVAAVQGGVNAPQAFVDHWKSFVFDVLVEDKTTKNTANEIMKD